MGVADVETVETVEYAITCISQVEQSLSYVVNNMSDTDSTKEILLLIRDFTRDRAVSLERRIAHEQK